jgi:hypothetical protein
MKRIGTALLGILLIIAGNHHLQAQDTTIKSTRPSVALFLPLYLFCFRWSPTVPLRKQFPKFFNRTRVLRRRILAIDTLGKWGFDGCLFMIHVQGNLFINIPTT